MAGHARPARHEEDAEFVRWKRRGGGGGGDGG